jgi:hypothetical protein
MNGIYPVAKLGDAVLIVNQDDLPYIGKQRAYDVKCVRVDLKRGTIDPVIELEKHLKFNPWEEMSEDERNTILQNISTKFSDHEILENIIQPLVEALVKHR